MKGEIRMTNDEWAEGGRVFGTADSEGSLCLRFPNSRYAVATIGKHLDDGERGHGTNPPMVASSMRQLGATRFFSLCRAIPSNYINPALSSPNGAKHASPGQRPGSRPPTILSPEGAAHRRSANPSHGSPLQGSRSFPTRFLGRCPGLVWSWPLALKNRNTRTEVGG